MKHRQLASQWNTSKIMFQRRRKARRTENNGSWITLYYLSVKSKPTQKLPRHSRKVHLLETTFFEVTSQAPLLFKCISFYPLFTDPKLGSTSQFSTQRPSISHRLNTKTLMAITAPIRPDHLPKQQANPRWSRQPDRWSQEEANMPQLFPASKTDKGGLSFRWF